MNAIVNPNNVSDITPPSKPINSPLNLATPNMVFNGEVITVKFEEESMSSIISRSTKSMGNISSTEGYRVDGFHKGDIEASTILITESAVVEGNIVGKRVVIMGKVTGSITATVQLIFSKSADVDGNVHYKDIVTFRGHQFEGNMKRIR